MLRFMEEDEEEEDISKAKKAKGEWEMNKG